MTEIKHIINIFPNELLQEIQTLVVQLKYGTSNRTVEWQDIEFFPEFIDSIDYIQEITSYIYLVYNSYSTSGKFISRESEQIYNAFKYYLPNEFVGYTLRRFHINRTPKTPGYPLSKHATPHYDSPENTLNECKTILFYVNSSDGNTILFNEFANCTIMNKESPINLSNINLTIAHEQTPLENSALIYSSNRLHTLRPPTITENRFVFNIVLEKDTI